MVTSISYAASTSAATDIGTSIAPAQPTTTGGTICAHRVRSTSASAAAASSGRSQRNPSSGPSMRSMPSNASSLEAGVADFRQRYDAYDGSSPAARLRSCSADIAEAAHPLISLSHQPGMMPSSSTRSGHAASTNSRPAERVGAIGCVDSRKYIAVTIFR